MVRLRHRAGTVRSMGEAVGGTGRQVRILLSWLQLWQGGQEELGKDRGLGLGQELDLGQEQ